MIKSFCRFSFQNAGEFSAEYDEEKITEQLKLELVREKRQAATPQTSNILQTSRNNNTGSNGRTSANYHLLTTGNRPMSREKRNARESEHDQQFHHGIKNE